MIRNQKRESGQGMTEYIIMVALIAVAAIGIYGLFGQTLRTQVGGLAEGLAGVDQTESASDVVSDVSDETGSKGLGNYGTGN